MAVLSLRILVKFDWVTEEVTRLWDGSGPMLDTDDNVWHGCSLGQDLDSLELAINGEAYTLSMTLAKLDSPQADMVWLSYTNDEILGAGVQIMIQPCDASDQPVGSPEVMFTGRIDNIVFDDAVEDERPRSTITVEVTNRFTLRRRMDGSVLSDADQKARSLLVNPSEDPDKFCERVPLMIDKTITWPKWN